MSLPREERNRRQVRPPADDDTYGLSEPVAPVKRPPPPIPSTLAQAETLEAGEPAPEPTRLPFLVGVFSFPWYFRTVAAWGMISLGLTVSLLGVVLCLYLADLGMGAVAVRCFGVPVMLIATLSLSYASACCVTVIETTAEGYDKVIDWPSGMWRDWFFTMLGVLGILALSLAVGGVLGTWMGIGTWLPAAWSAYVLFPIFVVSTLEAGSLKVLVSRPVLRSFRSLWWGWLLFYVETGALIAGLAALTVAGFGSQPWAAAFVVGPLLAALMLIYARLIGRLAWCLGEYGDRGASD